MKKKCLILLGVLSLATCGYFGARSLGQSLTREVELIPATTIPAGYTGVSGYTLGLTAPRPRGVDVKVHKRLMGVVEVNAAPQTGSNTLDVYFQSSPDCGMCWQDFAHARITGTGIFYVPISLGPDTAWPTTIPAAQDGALGNNVITPYIVGDRIRAKYNASFAQSSTGSWAFHVFVVPY